MGGLKLASKELHDLQEKGAQHTHLRMFLSSSSRNCLGVVAMPSVTVYWKVMYRLVRSMMPKVRSSAVPSVACSGTSSSSSQSCQPCGAHVAAEAA